MTRPDVVAQFYDEEALIVFETPSLAGPVVTPTFSTGEEETSTWVQEFWRDPVGGVEANRGGLDGRPRGR